MTPGPVRIGDHTISSDAEPFVIAELSANHNGSLQRALEIVDVVADAGAQAVKLQTYTADTMTIDVRAGEFVIGDPTSPWAGRSLYDLYEEAATPWAWHGQIFERCAARGLVGFSSAFDGSAVDFLESLGVPAFKIASAEAIDLPLIRRVAKTGKPIIVSTGMTDLAELTEAVAAARAHGSDVVVLKCTSAYPASVDDSNLMTIAEFRRLFDVHVGFSDHTLGIGAAVTAVALGASVIEKHVTLSRRDGGVDSAFSVEPAELKQLVDGVRAARRAIGRIQLAPTQGELKSRAFRRSLYIVEDMRRGELFTEKNLRAIRPGLGLPPKYLDVFLGKRIVADAQRGTALSWNHLG
jgi:N-acetylneuraminate synthase